MKKILITGKNSYIGTSFEKWVADNPEEYQVDSVGTKNGEWKEKDFSQYDVVFHVAGIAHVSSDPKMEDLYYKVNRDLTIEVAEKAKSQGVKQFIFMSSIIVYGDSTSNKRVITRETIPVPSNFYGNSKLQAEEGIRPLDSYEFKVVIIRPPMIYGKGSKGNYQLLSKLARFTPIFPDYDNQRSMLHIDNLTEFIRLVIDNNDTGIFYPQNKEYVKTSEMVREISKIHGKRLFITKVFNPIIHLCMRIKLVNKMFGNLSYDLNISEYKTHYQIREFYDTIRYTE
ncbi:NAD-dependent epimerase/dehydratase family protein [Jeotgalibaca porci]|uniref:NAD-dependent epimerase/dehydratase family protein n=1 Tax=Jeotgalibaca porci TaxID=1868793 RepID=A0A6G7WG54_9LACT|nr:NAD-dependent epimerase/dehydratase family protein [Jeotgalibaca porci]QIK51236.1 NAD-dependent epimerase/dehydratase family protein [Jeotgalibaca porci]